MSPYVAFKLDTGEITRTGYADISNFEQVAREGEGIITGMGTSSAHYVELETLTIMQKAANPALPLRTVGKVGEASSLKNVRPGSQVVVRNPGGMVVAAPTPNDEGIVEYVPSEAGRHTWHVTHPATFPVGWPLDVIA